MHIKENLHVIVYRECYLGRKISSLNNNKARIKEVKVLNNINVSNAYVYFFTNNNVNIFNTDDERIILIEILF